MALAGGSDGLVDLDAADSISSEPAKTGLYALDPVALLKFFDNPPDEPDSIAINSVQRRSGPSPLQQATTRPRSDPQSSTDGPATCRSDSRPCILGDRERRQLRTIVEYLKPAHTHFVDLIEPLPPVVPSHWELGLSDLGVTTDLH